MGRKQSKTGRLFILSAPSGTGKTTLCRRILSAFPDMRYSVSYTTRSPRNAETEGEDYHFISKEKFEQMIRENKWAEWAKVHENYYGTSAEMLEKELSEGHDVLLDIDVNGARQIIKCFPESVPVFIMPPTMDELYRRLKKRDSDRPEAIEKRLRAAQQEMACKNEYRHVIVNDDLEETVEKLAALIKEYRNTNRS
ncbi:MAG: guanylate kinase [Desulfosalsimonas sp.]